MRFVVDRWGTLQSNVGGSSDEQVADAVLMIKAAGHEVRVVSSMPEPPDVGDKFIVLQTIGAAPTVVVDDDRNILAIAARRGAITVPAEHLVRFAEMMRRS